jgi:DNA-binding NtrC family response regulator
MLGESPVFQQLLATLKHLARYDATVLLEGETGTGKELAARAVHYDGPRRAKPFLPINCGALQDSLIENELFGHCRGAYTGAHTDERGLVEAAEGGTLFLDEVDSLSPKGQVTLLRFLEDQQFRPIGSRTHRAAHVRVIAASNRPLAGLVDADRFRVDLLYRLCVLHVRVPPLRERAGDALLLARHFVQTYSTRFCKPVLPLSSDSVGWIETYHWPGNIRELENVVCQGFLLSSGPQIEIGSPAPAASDSTEAEPWSYRRAKQQAVAQFERRFLIRAIKKTAGNVTQAARLINTERRHLGRMLKKHGLERLALSSDPERQRS